MGKQERAFGKSEAGAERHGMIPEDWNRAVQLQAAVRDTIERPVSLGRMFDLLTRSIRAGELSKKAIARIREEFDAMAASEEADRIRLQKSIAQSAGK